MVGWHHRCNGHELGQTPEDDERQGSLACWSPWGHKDWTQLGDWKTTVITIILAFYLYISLFDLHIKDSLSSRAPVTIHNCPQILPLYISPLMRLHPLVTIWLSAPLSYNFSSLLLLSSALFVDTVQLRI